MSTYRRWISPVTSSRAGRLKYPCSYICEFWRATTRAARPNFLDSSRRWVPCSSTGCIRPETAVPAAVGNAGGEWLLGQNPDDRGPILGRVEAEEPEPRRF